MNIKAICAYGLAMMKTMILSLYLAASVATVADAACTAEYKAKRTDPTSYDHGRMSVPDSACTKDAAAPIVAAELAKQGWTLLAIVKVTKSN